MANGCPTMIEHQTAMLAYLPLNSLSSPMTICSGIWASMPPNAYSRKMHRGTETRYSWKKADTRNTTTAACK